MMNHMLYSNFTISVKIKSIYFISHVILVTSEVNVYMDYEKQTKVIKHESNHKINIEIIDLKIDLNQPSEKRNVVRAVCMKEHKILVVYAKDELIYGLPGGGIEDGESHVIALERELLEEVGANQIEVIEYLGQMMTHRKKYDDDQIFNPTHHLYLVDIKSFGKQNLIAYEEALGLSYDFVDLDEVIQQNEKVIKQRKQEYLDFYTNQTILFKYLKEIEI